MLTSSQLCKFLMKFESSCDSCYTYPPEYDGEIPPPGIGLTFSDNTPCVSDDLQVNCIKEVDSNCCPGLGQIDSELGQKIFTEVHSHQSSNIEQVS